MTKSMGRKIATVGKIAGVLALAALLAVGCYVAFVFGTFNRIEDDLDLQVQNNQEQVLHKGKEYSALTYNIGFGAYSRDYSFFMDEGEMTDGTKTVGASSRAQSREATVANTQGSIDILKSEDVDFALLQEVDTDSDRSYHFNQVSAIEDAFESMGSVEGQNYHSAYLFYPVLDPIGSSNSSLLTLSRLKVSSAKRMSYPISEGLDKVVDLDRCFTMMRVPVDDGTELVLINSHMSAYGSGGVVREKQLALLSQIMKREAEKGSYVIVGGDFNHALCGSLEMYKSDQKPPSWVSVMDDEILGEGFHVVRATNLEEVASVRGSDIPFEEGVTYQTTVDGFIVSSNIKAEALNVNTGYEFSDHNPVKLTFTLK